MCACVGVCVCVCVFYKQTYFHISRTLFCFGKAKPHRAASPTVQRCLEPPKDRNKDLPLNHEEQSNKKCCFASQLNFICVVWSVFSS